VGSPEPCEFAEPDAAQKQKGARKKNPKACDDLNLFSWKITRRESLGNYLYRLH
jgi:hypothetical protein